MVTSTVYTSTRPPADDAEASTFEENLQNTKATAVYYNQAGDIIGGAFTFVDFVPAGGNLGIEIDAQESLRGVARTDVLMEVTSLTLLS